MNQNNVKWTTQSRNSSESMPVGGYDLGCNVWVEGGEILLYLQQGGGFDENSSLLKQGRLRISFDSDPFADSFLQELQLQDGFIRITGIAAGAKTVVDLWVDAFRPVVQVSVHSERPCILTVAFENWRLQDRIVDSYSAELFQAKEVWMYPGTVTFRADTFVPQPDGLLFYHRNRDDLSFDKEMDAQGLSGVKDGLYNPQKNLTTGGRLLVPGMKPAGNAEGVYAGTPFRAWRFQSSLAVTQQNVTVVLHTAQTPDLETWRTGLETTMVQALKEGKGARSATQDWWHSFWERSHINLCPQEDERNLFRRIGQNYQLFRYLLGCNRAGFWPTKFNGGLFTFDPGQVLPGFDWTPDYRRWSGGTFTTQNQRLVYWPMLKNGDFDLMPAHFEFFLRLLETEKVRVREALHQDGAVYPEQLNWYGLCATVDHGWTNTTGLPVPQIKYLFSNQLEIGLMMLEHSRFTGADLSPCLDFLDQTVRFYDAFYPQTAEDGTMVLFPANALETYHPVRNPADAIAGLKCVLGRLVELPPELVGTDRLARWNRVLSRVPELPTRVVHGRTVLAAAETSSEIHNCELPQLYPVYPYGLYGLGRPDLEVAVDTARYTVETEQQLSHISWQNAGIAYARLGMKAEAFEFLKRKMADGPHRFPAFWGPGHDWTPDHNWGGSGMVQLQEMLLQTEGRAIRLFPCWDRNLDVDFKLHAPYQTVVEAQLRAGVLTFRVTPSERLADVEVLL